MFRQPLVVLYNVLANHHLSHYPSIEAMIHCWVGVHLRVEIGVWGAMFFTGTKAHGPNHLYLYNFMGRSHHSVHLLGI